MQLGKKLTKHYRSREEGLRHNRRFRAQYPLYSKYRAMLSRCFNPKNEHFSRYGGRGITVCERWLGRMGYANFAADMGDRPTPGHSLDRRDNDGNYCPENCGWATQREQTINRSQTVFLTFAGRTQCLAEWARELGISGSSLSRRIRMGWTTEQLLLPNLHKFDKRMASMGVKAFTKAED